MATILNAIRHGLHTKLTQMGNSCGDWNLHLLSAGVSKWMIHLTYVSSMFIVHVVTSHWKQSAADGGSPSTTEDLTIVGKGKNNPPMWEGVHMSYVFGVKGLHTCWVGLYLDNQSSKLGPRMSYFVCVLLMCRRNRTGLFLRQVVGV